MLILIKFCRDCQTRITLWEIMVYRLGFTAYSILFPHVEFDRVCKHMWEGRPANPIRI